MKFKLIDSDVESETESDWDTAIDLVTTTITDSSFLIEAENGVLIFFTSQNIDSSSRYLEPDFDTDPSGSGPMVWHDASEEDRSKNSYGFGSAVHWKDIEPISVRAFQAFLEQKRLGAHFSADFVQTSPENGAGQPGIVPPLSSKEVTHILSFLNRPTGPVSLKVVEESKHLDECDASIKMFPNIDHHDVGLNGELLKKIHQAFRNVDENQFFHVELPAGIEENIRRLGQEWMAKGEAQEKIIIGNMAKQSNARLQLQINDAVKIHQVEMEESNEFRRKTIPSFSRNCY